MARRQRQKSGNPMIRWWESQRDNHLNILYGVTTLGLGGLLWGLSFFLFLDGVNEYADLIGVTWGILLVGSIALSIAGPELFIFRNKLMILQVVLDLESRATITKRRKEAEEAATLLVLYIRGGFSLIMRNSTFVQVALLRQQFMLM